MERALQGLFEGEIQCREIDLVEALPPPVSGEGIEVSHESPTGVGNAVGGDDESDFQDVVVVGASQKDPTHSGSPRSLRRVKRRLAVLEPSVGGLAKTAGFEPPPFARNAI